MIADDEICSVYTQQLIGTIITFCIVFIQFDALM